MKVTTAEEAKEQGQDFLPIKGVDHIHFWVGNAKQSAEYYRHCWGFDITGYAGPETGQKDYASYLLEQQDVRFVLSTPLGPEGEMAEHIRLHGDGVKDVALAVDDAEKSFEETTSRGAEPAKEPGYVGDSGLKTSAIKVYGDTIHSFIERGEFDGHFWPNFEPVDKPGGNPGFEAIDHIVGNVGWGEMETWVDFYRDVMGFYQFIHFDDQDISTEYSALMSKVMAGGGGKIKFPINEPAEGKKKSQIEEYLDFYRGPGVQHIALRTENIIETVAELQERGVGFIDIPHNYYERVPERVGEIDEKIQDLEELGILVDRDDEGYLLQIFSKNLQDRPTVFFEVIQRKGAEGFGKGNFKALFKAIEREQEKRGNL